MTATLLLVLFVLLIVIRVPVAYSLAISTTTVVMINGEMPLTIIPQRMAAGLNSFPVMAIPFFLLAGTLMNTGGITQRLVGFANVLVGHIPGGLAHAVVVTNVVMAGMSGSAIADCAATGKVLIPALKSEGYDDEFAVGVVAGASTIGPIIPPSIPMVIFGVIAEVSIGRLFMGGVIPGLLMAASFMVLIYFMSRRRNYPRHPRATCGQLAAAVRGAALPLLMPLIVLGGIVGGIFTPTEAAVVAAVYSLFLGMVIYREIKPRDLPNILWEVAQTTVTVMFIFSAATVFSWLISVEQVPELFKDLVTTLTDNKVVALLLVNLLLLIMGCFLDTIAVLTIAVPIFVPLITYYQIDPVHFGLVVVLNLMMGGLTPPVGMLLYVMVQLTGIPFHRVVRGSLPFILPVAVVTLIITFVPELVLFLPNLLMR